LEGLNEWDNDHIFNILSDRIGSSGLARPQVLWPVRTALSGKPSSPCGATEIAELLGKDETLQRLRIGIKKLQNI
jgi:glutamyl-tRNA synthetase